MMTPTEFNEQTTILGKPSGMSDEECGSLPIFSDGNQTISCWKLSLKERLQILIFGKIWVGVVFGKTQPPIWLSSNKTVFQSETE
jgi:hypothetical protein